MTTPIRTRFAPSPTGDLHAGNYRTALFSWLYARKHDGACVLRIEDTDKERSKQEYEDNIHESLTWLGLEYDETYRQSERVEAHQAYLEQLVANGHAYISKEEAGESKEVIRFKNPNTKVTFTDLVRGEVTFDTTELSDFVIAKNMSTPLFHLAVVADDFDMGITHVIRGEDHISNTPRHILIQQALGAPQPIYMHLPLVLNTDREKLSKRNGAHPLLHYKEAGFLPDALVNYMALLGWNPGTEDEIFTRDELISVFDPAQINKSSAIFDETKLRWVNGEHLKTQSHETNLEHMTHYAQKSNHASAITHKWMERIYDVLFERIEVYSDVTKLLDLGEFDFLFNEPTYDIKALVWKKVKEDNEQSEALKITHNHLIAVHNTLSQLPETDFTAEKIKDAIWDYASEQGRGDVLWPLRYALTGQEKSPDPFTVASLLGKEKTLARITVAQTQLS